MPQLPDMHELLWALLAQIPTGKVSTYGALAEAMGDRKAARWVAYELLHHDHSPECPCHRVIRGTGELGLYIETPSYSKAQKLISEGLRVDAGHVSLSQYSHHDFIGEKPLEKLRAWQHQLGTLFDPGDANRWRNLPRLVAGIDVAYPEPSIAQAAYVSFDAEQGKVAWSTTFRREVTFPYISSYLSFRELPIMLELLHSVKQAGHEAEVLLVDGSGILHPRRAGIATHLGVVSGRPTIGVTKKRLCGERASEKWPGIDATPWQYEGEILGAALRLGEKSPLDKKASRHSERTGKTLYVSPGHLVDVVSATRIVLSLLRKHALPEPLYWADRWSRK